MADSAPATRVAQTAFVVFVPEAEALVADLRSRHDPSAQLRVAAHITVLFPFLAPASLTADVRQRCARIIGAHRAFDFSLATVGTFAATAYLAPHPAEPFVALTHALWHAYPDFPPFGGEFASVVAHLTVAHGSAAAAGAVAAELARRLREAAPIASRCAVVSLIENSTGTWRPMHAFPLAP